MPGVAARVGEDGAGRGNAAAAEVVGHQFEAPVGECGHREIFRRRPDPQRHRCRADAEDGARAFAKDQCAQVGHADPCLRQHGVDAGEDRDSGLLVRCVPDRLEQR